MRPEHVTTERNCLLMKKATPKKASSPVEESIQLLAQAKTAIGTVQRFTPADRRRLAKNRRGGQQVIPTIAALATKYGIATPNTTGTVLNAQLARVQELDPLVTASVDAHSQFSDAHLGASTAMWTSARTLYAMLKPAALTDPSLAAELKSVEEWFRQRKSPATGTSATPTTPVAAATPAAAAAATAMTPAPAVVPAVAVAPAH
jgi:hypothetical protein